MILYFVRHGTTDLNDEGLLRGWLNPELNDDGLDQANILADHFADKEITKIYSSDLSRASTTAGIIADTVSLPVEQTPNLRPINFGDYQGKKIEDIKSDLDRIIKAWQFDPNIKAPGGEGFKEFQDRTFGFITKVIDSASEDDNIILVTHIRVCLYTAILVTNEMQKLKGKDLDRLDLIDITPGNYMIVRKFEDKPRIVGINNLEQEEEDEEQIITEIGS